MSYPKKTVFLVDVTRVTLNKDCQYTLKTMPMVLYLCTEYIFVDVLNQNDRKCNSNFLSYNLLKLLVQNLSGPFFLSVFPVRDRKDFVRTNTKKGMSSVNE